MEDWLSDGSYLPPFMREFHAQKRLFKRIDEIVYREREKKSMLSADLPNWIAAHIYVVDFFLWFMARRGWTLQRSRRNFQFVDLHDDLEEWERRERNAMFDALNQRRDAASPTVDGA
jgi:hypothetical protein